MNISTKFFAGVALAMMAFGSQVAYAATNFIHEGIVYQISGNKLSTPKLTSSLKVENGTAPTEYTGDIVIPETIVYNGKTYTVTDLKNAFKGMPITSMQMPNSVIKISIGGFQDCSQLKSINISTGLTKIEQNTFTNCVSLEEITIPAGIAKVDANQFKGCTGLRKITIEEADTEISLDAGGFSEGGLDALQEVYIYRQLATPATMDKRPFRAAKALKKVVIGGKMTTLYDSFCDSSTLLESVELGEGVTALGTRSFATTGLTSITIPAGVTTIPSSCFLGARSLSTVVLPEGITSIEAMAFCNTNVSNINLPAGITSFGDMALQNAALSGTLAIPEATTRIGSQAFAANKLTEVSLPAGLKTYGDGAFMGNEIAKFSVAEGNENFKTELDGAYIASTDGSTIYAYAAAHANKVVDNAAVTTLAPYALYQASNVETINLPSCVNYGDYSLVGTGVTKLEVKGAVGRNVAASSPKLEELTYLGSEVPYGVANGCAKLSKVNLSNKVTVVKADAFQACSSLKSLNLGSILAIIEAGAFDNSAIENITVTAALPAVMPDGVFAHLLSELTVTVPVDLVDTYKAAEGWKDLNIAGDANLAAGPSDMGMPAGLYYAGEDDMLHCVYADGQDDTYDVGGVPHTFQLTQFKNRIYGASAGKKFVYSATGNIDGDGKLFYISKVGGQVFQATILDNAGNNAYKDPFGLYVYGDTLYVNDRNVCIRKIPANAISLPQDYPSWMENNWMAFYGAEWVYGCIKAGFAITQTTDAACNPEPLYWVGMKYNGNGIFRFRESNIGKSSSEVGPRPTEAVFFNKLDPIMTTFAVDTKNDHLYFYVDRMGKSSKDFVKGGLYRVNISDLEKDPEAAFSTYNAVLIDGAPVAVEGNGNEHVGIPQLALDDTGEYLYWCYRTPSASDIEAVEALDDDALFNNVKCFGWAEKFDASNPRHQDGIKRIKLGEENPEVELVAPGVRGYGVVAVNYEGSKKPEVDGVEVIKPAANLLTVAGACFTANEAAAVTLYNAAGLIVARVNLAAGETYTPDVEAGVYVGVAQAGAESQTFKFVK